MARSLAVRAGRFLLILFLAGFFAASLVRFAPGFGIDPLELDQRVSSATLGKLRQEAEPVSLPAYYLQFLARMIKGDLGYARTLDRPVTELIRARLPVTVRSVGLGLAAGWLAGLTLAASAQLLSSAAAKNSLAVIAGLPLCIPTGLAALLVWLAGWPPAAAIATVVFPKVFRYAHDSFAAAATQPHLLLAHAKGLGRCRLFTHHVLLPSAPQLAALAGVSINVAIGAAIPVETICDSPGLGQLTWTAAMGRDLPLLLNLTLAITAATLAANFLAEAAGLRWRGGSS